MKRLGWKVPFRQVYCDSLRQWARAVFWCHVVVRIFPRAVEVFDAPTYFEAGPKEERQ